MHGSRSDRVLPSRWSAGPHSSVGPVRAGSRAPEYVPLAEPDEHSRGSGVQLPTDAADRTRDRVSAGSAHGLSADDRAARDLPDRKSTRLNSSHLGISYAVF